MAEKKKKERKARVKIADLRAMTVEELNKKILEEEEELMRARFKHAAATLEDTAELRTKRRLIARIATVLNEKRV